LREIWPLGGISKRKRKVCGAILEIGNERAHFYRLTATGRKPLRAETRDWKQTAAIIARFFEVKAEDLP